MNRLNKYRCADLAQLVEQCIRNAEVGCSSHLIGTIFFIGSKGFLFFVKKLGEFWYKQGNLIIIIKNYYYEVRKIIEGISLEWG